MSNQHPSPACYFLDPTTRHKELHLHIKELQGHMVEHMKELVFLNEFSNYFKKSDEDAQHEATKVDPSYSLEDEAKRMFNEVCSAMEIVKESDFYCKLVNQLDSSVFQEQLKILLGSHSTLKMVIYALGCMEFNYTSIFQLAISLLMKERCSWIQEIEVYDPLFLRADIIVLKKAGCNVLTINENARRRVDKPTLFFMPCSGDHLVGNVFEANWCPSQINRLLLLCSRQSHMPDHRFVDEYFKEMKNHSIEIPLVNYGNDILDGLAWHFFNVDSHLDMDTLISGKVTKWERRENRRLSKEERLLCRRKNDEGERCLNSFTYQHCISEALFLEPYVENTNDDEGGGDENTKDDEKGRCDKNANEEKESRGDENVNDEKEGWDDENINDDEGWSDENTNDDEKETWIDLGRYRGPRKFRCIWHAPPKGWMKLNIASSSRRDKEEVGASLMITGYAGICHNQNNESVLDYKGKIDRMDQFAACVEALKIGLEEILKKFGQSKLKLIVETDNFKMVHWANQYRPPLLPAFQVEEFLQVKDLLKQYDTCIIYHVYEEANKEAICLAKRETS